MRLVLGAISGFVWGLGVAVLVQQFGIRPLDPLLLYGLPLAAALLTPTWAFFKGRPRVAAAVTLVLLLDPGSASAQSVACRVQLDFPDGRREILQESSAGDPIEIDLVHGAGLLATVVGPGSFAGRRSELWIELGGIHINVREETMTQERVGWEVSRDELQKAFNIPPGIYHVGGKVDQVCSGEGYIRLAGNPFTNPVGQAALVVVLLGLVGTWLAGRPRPPGGLTHSLMPESVEPARDTSTPPVVSGPVPDRTIQARICNDAGWVLSGAFLAGTTHLIQVHFGPPGAALSPPVDGMAVPEGGPGPVRARVVLTEPHLLDAPQVAQILIAESGASTPCEFSLTTGSDTTHVDARLIVLSGNRVLQTARLPSEVVPAIGGAASDRPKRHNVAEVETVVCGSTRGLAGRRSYDAAFVVNHDEHGQARVTGIADDHAAYVDLDEVTIKEAVEKIRRRLGEIVEQPEEFTSLEAEGTRDLLVFLAHHGRVMRNALAKDFLGPTLPGKSYLQVVSARPDAYFPFEFAYDYPAPQEKAPLCPDARAALEGPGFPASCPGVHHEGVVCPFGFWGISKVIERHAFQSGVNLPSTFLVRAQPSPARSRIPLNGVTLLAASERVDGHAAGSITRLSEALGGATNGNLERVDSWNDWTTQVGSGRAAVLLLLPHTVYSDPLDSYGLEIGTADRRWLGDIDERLVPPEDRPVVVILLGCETAAAGKVSYERFPGLFRRAGAEIVVGTLTEILGRHAAPVAQRLIQLLYSGSREGNKGFGELMVEMRRRYLAEGMPMVLALIAFGDADWIVTGGG